MASLARLPNEILFMCGPHCRSQTLAALSRTSRRFHSIFNNILYQRSLFEEPPYTPVVIQAAERGSLDTIKLAFSLGADINVDCFVSFKGTLECEKWASALHCACYYGHVHIVHWLLQAGALIDGDPKATLTPFFTALMNKGSGRAEICDLLINSGARSARRNPPKWALHAAIEWDCWSAVETLLTRTNSYSYPTFGGGETFNAAEAPTEKQYTALHHIAKSHDVEGIPQAVSMLLHAGAPLEATTTDWLDYDHGGTPLVNALKQLNWVVASALVKNGAKLFLNDGREYGLNALHLALLSRRKASSGSINSADIIRLDAGLRRTFISDFIKKAKQDNRMSDFIEQSTVGYLRGWNGTPLWYATSQASEPAIMRILLDEASASPNAMVGISEGGRESHPVAWTRVTMLRALIDCYKSLWDPQRATKNGYLLIQREQVLLEYGARLDAEADQRSGLASTVLQAACQRAEQGHYQLLDTIVERAKGANVRLEYVFDLAKKFQDCDYVRQKLQQLCEKLYKAE